MTEAPKDGAAPGESSAPPPLVSATGEDEQMDEEQMLLQQALALSMADAAQSGDTAMADAGEGMDAELAAGEPARRSQFLHRTCYYSVVTVTLKIGAAFPRGAEGEEAFP